MTDASWHTRPQQAALSDRVGHLAQLKRCVCCLQAASHRHPPPTTTVPLLHYLPCPSDRRPPPPKPMSHYVPFPPHHFSHTLRQEWRAPCRQLPSPAPSSTIDAEESIGLLRLMMAIRCRVDYLMNPISCVPCSRRWRSKKTSKKRNFGLQKRREEQHKSRYMSRAKERSPHGLLRSAFRSFF